MPIGPNLVTNADCDLAAVPHGSDWSASTRFTFNGDGLFASLTVFDGPGAYVMSVAYEASGGPIRVQFGDAGYFSLPASTGDIGTIHATVTNPATAPGISFDDLGDAAGSLVHVELRKLS